MTRSTIIISIISLNLVITPHCFSIGRRRPRVTLTPSMAAIPGGPLFLRRLHGPISPLRRRSLARLVRNIDVRDTATFNIPPRLGSPVDSLVLDAVVVWFGVLEDDVPGVQETWEVAETAEG